MSTDADIADIKAIIASRRAVTQAVHNAQLDVIRRIESVILDLVGSTPSDAGAAALFRVVEAVGRVKESVYDAGHAMHG